MINRLLDGIDRGDISVMDEVFHDDAVMEWPASWEQVVGAANRRQLYSHMPVLPKVSNRRVFGGGDLWVAEADADADVRRQAVRRGAYFPAPRRRDRD